MKIVARGAEAVLYVDVYNGEEVLIKERIRKAYRIPELDTSIRKQRTKREESLLERAHRAGVETPEMKGREEFRIVMEYIKGDKLKDILNSLDKAKGMSLYKLIGGVAAKLHQAGIIHGDLTTSNMILKGDKLFLIDFGLGKMSDKIEDQAVDMYLLYEALKSTHFNVAEEAWKVILNTYMHNYTKAREVMNRIEKIKKRRRYLGD